MKGQEQRERHTAVAELNRRLNRMDQDFHLLLQQEKDLLTAEIESRRETDSKLKGEMVTFINRLADEQRRYVDSADRDMLRLFRDFRDLTFWGRVKWMLTGQAW
jgi:hypothetical protein